MDKILIVYGSLNSVPSPEGAAPAKVIVDTVKHLDKESFQVLSNFNDSLDASTYDTTLYNHVKPSVWDKCLLLLMKAKYSYAKRKERLITAQDSQLLYFIAVSRYIKKKGYKKVVIHVSTGLVEMVKHYNPTCEIVFYHHGTSLHSKLSELQWHSLLKNTVAIFGVNQAAATLADRHFKTKLPPKHYFKIPNGVDCMNVQKGKEPHTNSFKILFSGRICKEKGVLELIKAFKILKDKNYDVELIIAGNVGTKRGLKAGSLYLKSCEQYIEENNLIVKFTGFLLQYELYNFYQKVNILVLPTDPKLSLEGMPLSLLEAMSVGTPLIATNVGGNSEVIKDGYNGFLIYGTENYEEEIAEKIEQLYLNEGLEKSMIKNSHEYYKSNFSTENMSQAFLKAIQEIGFINE